MKTTNNFSVLFFFLISSISLLNSQSILSGKVNGEHSKDALGYSTISIYNMKDSLITGGITDDNGFFEIPLNPDSYNLICSYIGYTSDTSMVVMGRDDIFLGNINMKLNQTQLDEIIVTGSTSSSVIDKEIQLVTATMRNGTTNSSEVLERIKGLSYDRYNQSIKVDGDNNIIMLVNGLEKNNDYIKNLAPDRMKEIEIIRNPSGRYALDGYTAIINIILKNDYRGVEFYIENTALLKPFSENNEYLPVNMNSLSFNYTYDKFNFYFISDNKFTGVKLKNKNFQDFKNGIRIENNNLNDDFNLNVDQFDIDYTLGVDFYLNPQHTLSIESNIKDFPKSKSIIDQEFAVRYIKNGNLSEQYSSKSNNISHTKSYTNSLFYIYKYDKNTRIDANLTYYKYIDNYNNITTQTNGYKREEIGVNQKALSKAYIEITHDFNNNSTLMGGYGNTYKNQENDFESKLKMSPEDQFKSDKTNFQLTELRHKAYAYYSGLLSDKMSYKIGTAVEYSHPKVGELEKSYFIYQPHFDLKYKAHKMVDIKLKYRTYSNYPSIKQSTPIEIALDPYSKEKGNPYLKPELVHHTSIKFSIMKGLFSLEPYYKFSNNRIGQTVSTLDDGTLLYSYENIGLYKKNGIKANITIPLFNQQLIFKSNIDVYASQIEHETNINKLKDWSMNTQLIYLGKKYHTVAGLIYQKENTKFISTYGYSSGNNDYWLLFVQQPFLKNKLSIMLGYMLPTDIAVIYDQDEYIDSPRLRSLNTTDISLLKNMILLKVSYRFSKGKQIKTTDKNIDIPKENNGAGMF